MAENQFDSSLFIRSPALRGLYRPVRPLVERAIGWPRVREVYGVASAAAEKGGGTAFLDAALAELNVAWTMSEGDKAMLAEADGPLVVAVNHPFGGIDALALFALLAELRGESFCCLANRFLAGIPEISDHCLLVDPRGEPSDNRRSLGRALARLRKGEALCLFPAARVSARSEPLGAVLDLPWSDHAVRLAAKAGARLAVLHIAGQNSDRFLDIPTTHVLRRTFALVGELARPPVETVSLSVSAVLEPGEVARVGRSTNAGERLRAICYSGAERRPGKAPSAAETKAPSAAVSLNGIDVPEPMLDSGGFELLRFRGDEQPELLEALGRAREITFRAAGQGTGKEVDISPEDSHYHHLVIREQASGELVGAYRLGLTQEILAEHGPAGLYLDHVFEIDPAFYEKVGPAMELSRSFVMPHFQRDSRALALLWGGLGKTATEFHCRNLFGSVTISDAFQPASRAALAAHLRQEHADRAEFRELVRARVPFEAETAYHPLVNDAWKGEPATALWPVVGAIERGERTPPPLIKYYLSLGAKFIDFHVEAAFGDALYCLLRVDLETMPERYRRRFL